jgi:hypothetical protein
MRLSFEIRRSSLARPGHTLLNQAATEISGNKCALGTFYRVA